MYSNAKPLNTVSSGYTGASKEFCANSLDEAKSLKHLSSCCYGVNSPTSRI